MTYLISHLWMLYLLSLILAGIAYAVIDISDLDAGDILLSAIYAVIPELIALSGIYFYRKRYMIPAVIVAVLCCIAVAAAVLLFFVTAKSSTYTHIPSFRFPCFHRRGEGHRQHPHKSPGSPGIHCPAL